MLEAIAYEINYSGRNGASKQLAIDVVQWYVVFNCRMEVVHAHTHEFNISNPAPSSIFLDVPQRSFF